MAIPSGEIYLLKNVPLMPSYEHTIDFKNKDEQFSYFLTFLKPGFNLGRYTYIRKERESVVLDKTMNELDDINYMVFRSQSGERLYYAFVTNKRYVGNGSTELTFVLDVMQTYMFDYKWKASYIAQSHVDRWNAEHKPIYSKTDEGLDYGSEYSIESAFRIEQSEHVKWLLVSCVDYSEMGGEGLITEGGTINPAPSPYVCFLVPLPIITNGVNQPYSVKVFTYGANSFVATYTDLVKLMQKSAFGNYVKSVTLLNYNPFVTSESIEGEVINIQMTTAAAFGRVTFTEVAEKQFLILQNAGINYLKGNKVLARGNWNIGLEHTLPTEKEWEEVKANPYTTKRDKRFESKLLCAPYRYNLLTDWRNSPVVFKNEYMTTDKIEIRYSNALSYNAPFRYWIKDYKKDPEGRYTSLMQPIGLEFPVMSDAYYTYMLENKNTIQANLQNSLMSGVASIGTGAIGGALGMMTSAVGAVVNTTSLIRSENAKQSDLKAKPDSTIVSVDSSFNVLDNNVDITFYRMRICCENEEIIGEIFNMSGYKVNRVEIPNTRSRTRFNYLQTIGANIVGSINQSDLMQIKEIYDKGITIWHYHKDHFNFLDYSYENMEVNLI